MNIFIIALIGIFLVSMILFVVLMSGDDPTVEFPKEHYTITIIGLKDTYLVDEPYSFSYVLSGFGTLCGGKLVTFPVNKTHNVSVGSSASCVKTFPTNFVLDIKETYGTTYGHIALQETGNYTIMVQFEKGDRGPTVAEKTFAVVAP